MSDSVLNEPARDLLSLDHPGLNRLLRALELNAGMSYMHAYDKFSKASEEGGTVRQALETLGVTKKLSAIEQDLVTLERADEARAKIFQLDSGPVDNDQRSGPADPAGRSDQRPPGAYAPGTDTGIVSIDGPTYERVMNQPLHSERYFAAKNLEDRYNSPEGPNQWLRDDQQHALSGVDLLKTMRGQRRAASAASARADANRRLDQALEGRSPSKRKVRLEAAISEAKAIMLDAPGGRKLAKQAKRTAKARQAELAELAARDEEYARDMKRLSQEG
jgi:hypothetical protein